MISIIRRYEKITPLLDDRKKILGIENEPSTNTGNGKETAEFLRELNHPRVKAIWDPANNLFSEVPEDPFPDGYSQIKRYLVHVHIKDARRTVEEGPSCVPIGHGQVDWKAQIRQLKVDGYAGFLSLETHWRPTPLSEPVLRQPGGNRFSEEGEGASRICLENLALLTRDL